MRFFVYIGILINIGVYRLHPKLTDVKLPRVNGLHAFNVSDS